MPGMEPGIILVKGQYVHLSANPSLDIYFKEGPIPFLLLAARPTLT